MPSIDFDKARHPEYLRYLTRWEMAYDFWRGGLHVLQPSGPRTNALVATERGNTSSGGLDAEQDIQPVRYSWRTVPVDSYLFKHQRESEQEFDDRCQRQINFQVFQYVCNTLAAGVLRDHPVRDGVNGFWTDYHSDVDMAGTDIDAYMRRVLSLGLVFGRMHSVTDRPSFGDDVPSRRAQIDRGERAYSYLITPLDLVDWSLDEYKRFKWATVIEPEPDIRMPGENPDSEPFKKRCQYRVWYPDHWELWRERPKDDTKTDERWFLFDEDSHTAGRVPISTLYCTRYAQSTSMACESPVADTLDINRDTINKLSELDELERSQTFALLGIPLADGMSMGGLDIGPFRAFGFPASSGAPVYVDPNPAHPQGKWERTIEKTMAARQFASVSRGKSEYSKEERSASALAVESEDKRNQLAWWSKALQEFDLMQHQIVAAIEGEDTPPTASYSTNFDVKGIMVEVQELLQLASVPVVQQARKTQALLASPVIRKMLVEQGAEEKDIAAAISDLQASANKEPETTQQQTRQPGETSESLGGDDARAA